MAKNIRHIPNKSLFVSTPEPYMFGNPANASPSVNWLTSRFHFSFAEYHDHARSNFGVLRVMNDDLVQPQRGFGTHPHSEMEIVTYVVEGELTHKDSTGTQETLSRGSVQFMSAGTGIRHSEFNNHPNKPLRFIQMWVQPGERRLRPNYGSWAGDAATRKNQWQHVVGKVGSPAHVGIHQDANFHVTELDAGASLELRVGAGRQAYLLCVEGSAAIKADDGSNGPDLERHDAAAIKGEVALTFTAGAEGAHLLCVEMAQSA